MFPKYHFLYGAIFSLLVWLLQPNIGVYAFVIFFSTFLLDFDHYLVYSLRNKELSFSKSVKFFVDLKQDIFKHLKKGVRTPLVIFHTFEFIIVLFVLALFLDFFLFFLLGVLFHTLLDVIFMITTFKTVSPRPFSLIFYFINRRKNKKGIKYL